MKENQYIAFTDKGIYKYKGKLNFEVFEIWLINHEKITEYFIHQYYDDDQANKMIIMYLEDCLELEYERK